MTLAEKLHEWYLEATKKLNPESFNPNAQESYDELTEEQKFIDKYIAQKIRELIPSEEDIQKILWEISRIEIGSPASIMLAQAIAEAIEKGEVYE